MIVMNGKGSCMRTYAQIARPADDQTARQLSKKERNVGTPLENYTTLSGFITNHKWFYRGATKRMLNGRIETLNMTFTDRDGKWIIKLDHEGGKVQLQPLGEHLIQATPYETSSSGFLIEKVRTLLERNCGDVYNGL